MNLPVIFFTALFLTITGCGDKSAEKTPIPIEITQAPKRPQVTLEDWKKAVEATHEKLKVKDTGDGIESFTACFEPTPEKKKKCTNFALGERDKFKKITFYTAGVSLMVGKEISAYVSLPDNDKPALFLTPSVFSRTSWLFMKKLSIMVDGEVVLEQDLSNLKADREVFPGGVEEAVHFIAAPKQIDELRKINEETKFIIRITGEKGYVTLNDLELSAAKKTLINAVNIYDRLNNAVHDKIPTAKQETKS